MTLFISSVLLSGCSYPPHFEGQYIGTLGDQCIPGSGLPAALDMHLDIRVDEPEKRNPSYVARLRTSAFGEFPVSAPGKLDGHQLVFEFDKDEVRGWTGYQPQLLVVIVMYLVLPALWMSMLAWAGYNGGGAVAKAVEGGQKPASDAGQKGGEKAKNIGTKGKL